MKTSSKRLRIAALLAAVACPVAATLAFQQPAPTIVPATEKQPPAAPVPAQLPAPAKAPPSSPPPGLPVKPMPSAPTSGLPEALKIDNMKFDWGDISDTDPVEHAFTFTNISDKSITLAVAASCGCTVPTMEKTTYAPGENGKVTARFDPHNRQGPQTKTLTFTVTNPQGVFAQQITTLTANVKALVTFDPPKMFLSEVDHTAGQTTKLKVTGRLKDFKVQSVTPNSEFVKATLGEPKTTEVNGETMTEVPITLDVGKNAPIGTMQAQIVVVTNDARAKIPPYFMGADIVGDIKATPAQAILRVNDPSVPFTTQVKFDSRSGSAFNILSVETDARKEMQVVTDVQKAEDGNYYMITISGVTPPDGGMVQSNLTVSTDARGGETVKVPFTAVIRKMATPPMPKTGSPNVVPVPPPTTNGLVKPVK